MVRYVVQRLADIHKRALLACALSQLTISSLRSDFSGRLEWIQQSHVQDTIRRRGVILIAEGF